MYSRKQAREGQEKRSIMNVKSIFQSFILAILTASLVYAKYPKCNEVAARFKIPELAKSTHNADMVWFTTVWELENEPDLFLGLLARKLQEPTSFPNTKAILARYVLRKVGEMSSVYSFEGLGKEVESVIKVLLSLKEYDTLIQLFVTYPRNLKSIVNSIDFKSSEEFFEALKQAPMISLFYDQLLDPAVEEDNHFMYLCSILYKIPEEHYLEYLLDHGDKFVETICLLISEARLLEPSLKHDLIERIPALIEDFGKKPHRLENLESYTKELYLTLKFFAQVKNAPFGVTLNDLGLDEKNITSTQMFIWYEILILLDKKSSPIYSEILTKICSMDICGFDNLIDFIRDLETDKCSKELLKLQDWMEYLNETDKNFLKSQENYKMMLMKHFLVNNINFGDQGSSEVISFVPTSSQSDLGITSHQIYRNQDRKIDLNSLQGYFSILKFTNVHYLNDFIEKIEILRNTGLFGPVDQVLMIEGLSIENAKLISQSPAAIESIKRMKIEFNFAKNIREILNLPEISNLVGVLSCDLGRVESLNLSDYQFSVLEKLTGKSVASLMLDHFISKYYTVDLYMDQNAAYFYWIKSSESSRIGEIQNPTAKSCFLKQYPDFVNLFEF